MRIERRKWQQVDNVANMFLATYNRRDPRVMRVSCTLKEEIDPEALQDALNATVSIRPQFQVKIHRGLFWRYIEETSDMPAVSMEKDRICPQLYFQDRPEKPLYKVTWFNNRINMDIFHAISDGTGAMEFLNILVVEYLRRVHPDVIQDIHLYGEETSEELTENSFKTNFDKDRHTSLIPESNKVAYHPPYRKLPFDQLQFFEAHMPLGVVKDRAKNFGVTVSSYIGAALMLALIDSMPAGKRRRPVTVSMPVNLRNFYKSSSLRNFFNNVSVTHVYDGKETLKTLSIEYQKQLTEALEPEKVKDQMNYFQGFQNQWAIRAVPLALKEPGLNFFAKQNEMRVSAVLSNIGVVKFPDKISDYIDHYTGYCSSENPFVVLCSFKDVMTLGISYPYSDPRIIRKFINILSEKGIPVKLYATEVVR